jgi:hypothetical protein
MKTYKSIINSLYKKLRPGKEFDMDLFFDKPKEVISYLHDHSPIPSRRKTTLSALVVLTAHEPKVHDQYRSQMMDDISISEKKLKEQEKSETQKDNWMSLDEIKKIYNELEKDVRPLWTKRLLNMADLQKLQDFIILSMYILQPPRRLKDYTEFKIRNIDKENDNYFDKKAKKLVYNNYKTAKFYNQQKVDINPRLEKILKKWEQINPTDYLLFDYKQQKLRPDQLTRRLNGVFGKKISVNLLRHIYLSDGLLKDVPALKQMEKVAEDMGHSVNEQLLYKKK